MTIPEAAEILEVDLARLKEILKEQTLITADLQPTEDALLSGFMKPGGIITKRGMTLLISLI